MVCRCMCVLPDVERSCLNGCLLFLVVEKGVMGALGRRRFRWGSFSMSFLWIKRTD